MCRCVYSSMGMRYGSLSTVTKRLRSRGKSTVRWLQLPTIHWDQRESGFFCDAAADDFDHSLPRSSLAWLVAHVPLLVAASTPSATVYVD